MKRLFKWFAWLIGVVLILLVLVLGGVYLLAGTDKGFEFATAQIAKRVPGLQLGNVGGNLLRGLSGDSVGFASDAFDVDVSGLDSEWRASCLTKRRFCLDRLVVDEVVFALKPSDEPVPEPTTEDIVLPEISLPIGIDITEVLIRRFVFRPAGVLPGEAGEQIVNDIRLAGSLEGDTVMLTELSVGRVAQAAMTINADATGNVSMQGDWPIDLDLNVAVNDVLEGQDVAVALELDDTVANLALDAQLSGAVAATLAGHMQPLKKNLPVDATLTSAAVGWPLDTQALVKASDLTLGIDGTLEDYALTLGTTVTGEQVPPTTLDIAGSVNTERVVLPEMRITTLGGTIGGNAQLNWTDGLAWLTALKIVNVEPGRQVEGLSGALGGDIQASGTVDGEVITLDVPKLLVTGTLNGFPFKLDAIARKGEDDLYRIDRLRLDNGRNQIKGSGTIGERVDVSLTARLPELQNILPGLAGGFDADIKAKGPLVEPDITLDASSSVITFQDIVVQGVSIDGDVARAALKPSTLNVAVGEVQVAGQVASNIRLGADGTRAKHEVTLFADGPERTAVDLAASGELSESFDWKGLLDAVRLEVPAHTITLAQPTALEWDNRDKLFGIDAHCWTTEQTNLCLENNVVVAKSGDARITLDNYPLARLNPFLPAESTLDGGLGMQADIAWGDAQPGGLKATVNTRIEDGGFTVRDAYDEPVSFNYELLTLDTVIDPTAVDAKLALDSNNLGSARADVQIDPAGEQKPIDGTISLDGLQLVVARAFLPDFDEIGGTLSANGELGGTLTDPRFDGDIVLDSPVIKGESLPLDVTGGRITTNVTGKRATIGGGIDAGGGRIDVDGRANWQRERWRAEVTLTGDDLDVRTDPVQESSINHTITIVAQPQDIRVDGRIEIPMAIIDVAELPKGAATLSDDIVVIEDVQDEETVTDIDQVGAVDPPGDTRLRVDIDVSLGDDVEFDAYGLTANLTGDMGIAMRSPDPLQLSGEIDVVDGVFKKYGQNLTATGQVLFVGPVSATRLDIEAVRDIEEEDRVAGLRIGGDVEQPEITLFTEPDDKSNESILSYIILGRDIGDASDQDASLLAAAALALTVKGGKVVGQGIADSLGIEEFGFETQGKGDDTELVVSGRINDRLLVKYGQSVFENGSTLYLRYDLTKKLYLEAAEGASTAVDLFYEFAF